MGYTASLCPRREMVNAVFQVALCGLIGLTIGTVHSIFHTNWVDRHGHVAAWVRTMVPISMLTICVPLLVWRDWQWRMVDLAGAAISGYTVAILFTVISWSGNVFRPSGADSLFPVINQPRAITSGVFHHILSTQIYVPVAIIAFSMMSEVDRIRYRARKREAANLSADYKGSVRFARCSMASDEERIHDAIGDSADSVDEAVRVLITAGMSTPSLYHAAALGVDVTSAGYVAYAYVLLLCLHTCWEAGLVLILPPSFYDTFCCLACMALLIAWLALCLRLPPDGRAFAVQAMQNLGFLIEAPSFIAIRLVVAGLGRKPFIYVVFDHTLRMIVVTLALITAGAGIDQVAKIRYVGVPLAQWLICRHSPCNRQGCEAMEAPNYSERSPARCARTV